jgi:hypothetical protein
MFTKFESINEKNNKILEETKRAFPPIWLNEKQYQGLSKFQLAKSMSNIKDCLNFNMLLLQFYFIYYFFKTNFSIFYIFFSIFY